MSEITRVGLSLLLSALLGGGVWAAPKIDANLAVLLSDCHIGAASPHACERLHLTVDEILALDPRPAVVAILGDIALFHGEVGDYRLAARELRRLTDGGIRVVMTMGNHDVRENFHEVFPEHSKSPVPGRIVARAHLGSAEIILLDTLWQDQKAGVGGVDGEMTKDQLDWLSAELAKPGGPVLVAGHHPLDDDGKFAAGEGAKGLKRVLMSSPRVIGYIDGHDHVWKTGWFVSPGCEWKDSPAKKWLCLPSTGHWGDIGYALLRIHSDRAVATLVEKDYWYPVPNGRSGNSRLWADFAAENQGRTCTFRFPAGRTNP